MRSCRERVIQYVCQSHIQCVSAQDVLLPYMADPRHADDTLFIVCEEDFRLYERDQPSQAALLWADAEPLLRESQGSGASSSGLNREEAPPEPLYKEALQTSWQARNAASAAAMRRDTVSPSPCVPPLQQWPSRTQKPKPADFENPSVHLKDIIRLCTAAHRHDRGNVVWLTWNGDTGKKAEIQPSYGSMMIGVSWLGANWLKENWGQVWRGHYDLSLKWICENMSADLKASFVYPSIGHYASHGSGILLAERRAVWKEWWVQEGVRKPARGPGMHREIWGWKDKGSKKGQKTECLEGNIDLAALDTVLDWKTYFAPDPNADWPEPIAGQEAGQPSSASSACLGQEPPAPTQEQMRRAFAQERMVGLQVAETKRARRARRMQLLESGYRIFTTDVCEADSFRCQLDIQPWIRESSSFCRSVSSVFCT